MKHRTGPTVRSFGLAACGVHPHSAERWTAVRSAVVIGFSLVLVSAFAYASDAATAEASAHEDEALLNVVHHLGYLRFLALDDYAQLRELVDVNLNN